MTPVSELTMAELSRFSPLGLLPVPARAWLSSLGDRPDLPAEALPEISANLASTYLAEWGLAAPVSPRYGQRVAEALGYHWWRHCEGGGFRPLDQVVPLVQAGRLAYGRVKEDVLRE